MVRYYKVGNKDVMLMSKLLFLDLIPEEKPKMRGNVKKPF